MAFNDVNCLKVVRRGAPPRGGGQVVFDCPIVKKLKCVQLTEMGRIRRVRGVAYTVSERKLLLVAIAFLYFCEPARTHGAKGRRIRNGKY